MKRPLINLGFVVISWFFCLGRGQSQTLNLPPRSASALTGQQFVNVVSSMDYVTRENWIFAQVASGNIPDWMRTMTLISTNAVINSVNHTVSYYVIPDYLAIGSSNDYILQPMSPMLAQRLCVLLNCTLPTRKMVNDIWQKALVKMNPTPITYDNNNPPVTEAWFNTYNTTVSTQRLTFLPAYPLGDLIGGDKKDVILSTYIYNNLSTNAPTPVVIYGWQYTSGTPIQPLFNGHANTYMDYSHGIRLVQQAITVDGSPTTVSNVLVNPALAALLSDEAVFSGDTIPQPYYSPAATAPVIIAQPYTRSVKQGTDTTFCVLAAGDGPMTYFWKHNGAALIASTNSSLLLTNVHGADAGTYSVVVSNQSGTATSWPSYLWVSSNAFPILFSDNLDADTSSNWNFYWGADDNLPDYTTNWAFNYGAAPFTYNGVTCLIPPAPNSTSAIPSGVKFTVNDLNASDAGVNIYPKGQSFSGNFALKFDVWINYPGNAGGSGGSGTTQYAIYGLNFLGTEANWGAASAASTDGIWFGHDGDGGAVRDYRAYLGNRNGVQTELIGAASGLSQSNHATFIYTNLLPTPPSETTGTPGKTWASVEIDQTNGTLTWKINGTIIAQRANASAFTNGNIMVGLMDVFPSVASPVADSYVLYDNVRVENLSAAPITAPAVTVDPRDQNLNPGQTASFSVAANGSNPMSYQWFDSGIAIAGQTNATCIISNIQPSNIGQYYAQVANDAGSTLSNPARLTVSTNWSLVSPQIANGQIRFSLWGLTNTSYVIDVSSNLIDWTPLVTNPPGVIVDELASNGPARFYQARPLP